jgi:hypothetical protein
MMVSYTRARAEGLGIECKDGLMQRPERVIIIGVSALACGIASRFMGGDYKIAWPESRFPVFETISIFTIPLTILAFLANATAIGRLRDARRALEARAANQPNGAGAKTTAASDKTSTASDKPTTTASDKPTTPVSPKKSIPGATVILLFAVSLIAGLPTGAQTASAASPAPMAPYSPGVLHPRPPVINDPVDTFPIPPTNPNSLFYLQRTPNTNTIICELNQPNGILDKDEPVKVLWIRYTEQRQRQDLNFIQRHFAYGLKERDLGNGVYELRFVSYKKVPMYLKRSPVDNRHHVYVSIDGRQAILTRVYIRIDPGGTFWSPNVKYLELKGVDAETGKELIQRLKV